jgi:hypothetical protein
MGYFVCSGFSVFSLASKNRLYLDLCTTVVYFYFISLTSSALEEMTLLVIYLELSIFQLYLKQVMVVTSFRQNGANWLYLVNAVNGIGQSLHLSGCKSNAYLLYFENKISFEKGFSIGKKE